VWRGPAPPHTRSTVLHLHKSLRRLSTDVHAEHINMINTHIAGLKLIQTLSLLFGCLTYWLFIKSIFQPPVIHHGSMNF
jgi:hypothetical protein